MSLNPRLTHLPRQNRDYCSLSHKENDIKQEDLGIQGVCLKNKYRLFLIKQNILNVRMTLYLLAKKCWACIDFQRLIQNKSYWAALFVNQVELLYLNYKKKLSQAVALIKYSMAPHAQESWSFLFFFSKQKSIAITRVSQIIWHRMYLSTQNILENWWKQGETISYANWH